jgi:hypothetical protein
MKLPAKFQKVLPKHLNWVEKAAVVLIVAPVLGTALVGIPLLASSLLWRKFKRGEETGETPKQLPPPPVGGDESDGE